MKTIVFILGCLMSVTAYGRTLVVGPDEREIPAFAFENDDMIDTLMVLPRGNRPLEIGEYAFWNSSGLRVIIADDESPLHIAEGAFRDCGSLSSISLPKGTRLLGGYCFSGCRSLTAADCSSISDVIPQHTFSYCPLLAEIVFSGYLKHIGNNAFSECVSLLSVYLPDSLTELESYAFSGCEKIKEARLPANGALLGELIFSGCHSLECLREPSVIVPGFDCLSYIFEPDDVLMYEKCVLEVPEGMSRSYSEAPGWSLFRNIRTIREP